jgi:hypothetical protein
LFSKKVKRGVNAKISRGNTEENAIAITMKKFMKAEYHQEVIENKKFVSLKLLKRKIRKFMNLTMVNIVMTVVTIYALFGDDFRLIYAPVDSDSTFTGLSIVSMVLFALELILSSVGHEHY